MNIERRKQAYDQSRLGKILVRRGYLKHQELEFALDAMESKTDVCTTRLGEYLIDHGLITRWQLRLALSSQSQFRLAACLSMVLLSQVQQAMCDISTISNIFLATLVKHLLKNRPSESKSSKFEFDPFSAQAEFRNNGQIRLRQPTSYGELTFDHLIIKESAIRSEKTLEFADIDLSQTSLQVRSISEIPCS